MKSYFFSTAAITTNAHVCCRNLLHKVGLSCSATVARIARNVPFEKKKNMFSLLTGAYVFYTLFASVMQTETNGFTSSHLTVHVVNKQKLNVPVLSPSH